MLCTTTSRAAPIDNPRPGVIINHPSSTPPAPTSTTSSPSCSATGPPSSPAPAAPGAAARSWPASPTDDHVFVYYSDHGGPGVLGMPSDEYLYAMDLVQALKTKHAAGGYKNLVFYLEACESGSIFEGLLPDDISVYATTAANAEESSWGTYCPGDDHMAPPPEFDTCLGDLYSVAWMEDSDAPRDHRAETLEQQYEVVKDRTSANGTYSAGSSSHAMQYGDLGLGTVESLYQFMGTDPANDDHKQQPLLHDHPTPSPTSSSKSVNQRDADLVHFWQRYRRSAEGTPQKAEARSRLMQVMSRRARVDSSVELIGALLFGAEEGGRVLGAVRPAGQPLADDWDCLKSMVRAYERHCGPLGQYGMKHMRSLANICNAGVGEDAMAKAASQACAVDRIAS